MVQEYTFENKKYESAVTNIKAILMDIISSEMDLISKKEQEISIDRNKKTTAKLKEICDREKLSIKKLLEISNSLVNLLEQIDICSKDFTAVLAENIAQIVENYRINESKSNESTYENNVQEKANQSAKNIENPTNSKEIKQDNHEIQDKTISKQDISTKQIEKEVETPSSEQEPLNKNNDSTKVVANETKASAQIPSISKVAEQEKESSESNIILPPIENEEATADNSEYSINKSDTENISPSQETSSDRIISPSDTIPIIKDSVDTGKVQESNENLSSENNISHKESNIVVQPVEEDSKISPVSIEDENNQNSNPPENDDKVLVFNKINNNEPRAILTSAKQISNLRQSLPTQEALVQARDSIASTNVAGVNDEIQELVNSGVIAPSKDNIEDMMAEASRLYQEGKTDEAQAMYDKISELNKQMKENNQDEAKPIELTKNNSATFAA